MRPFESVLAYTMAARRAARAAGRRTVVAVGAGSPVNAGRLAVVMPRTRRRPGTDDRVERHDDVPLLRMVGEDLDGALDLAGRKSLAQMQRQAVLEPLLEGVELVTDEVLGHHNVLHADGASAAVPDVELARRSGTGARDAEGHLRRP